MNTVSKQRWLFILLFALLGFAALQVPVATLVGSKAKFTLFDAFMPVAGGFLGTIPGMIAVFFMQLSNFLFHGANVLDAGTIIRFFPPLMATAYFARNTSWNIVVPIIAIAAFSIHPIGRSVWYFSLYWLIPIACSFLYERSLIARSLGATFSAHAVGGALWIYTFNLPATVWQGLIPIVAIERLLFTAGIVVTTIVLTNVLEILRQKQPAIGNAVSLNRLYVWKRIAS